MPKPTPPHDTGPTVDTTLPGDAMAPEPCPCCRQPVKMCEARAYSGRHEDCSVGVLKGSRSTYGRRLEGCE